MGWKVVESEAVLEATQLHHHSNIYLNLEQIRFNDRLVFFFIVPETTAFGKATMSKGMGKSLNGWCSFGFPLHGS